MQYWTKFSRVSAKNIFDSIIPPKINREFPRCRAIASKHPYPFDESSNNVPPALKLFRSKMLFALLSTLLLGLDPVQYLLCPRCNPNMFLALCNDRSGDLLGLL